MSEKYDQTDEFLDRVTDVALSLATLEKNNTSGAHENNGAYRPSLFYLTK